MSHRKQAVRRTDGPAMCSTPPACPPESSRQHVLSAGRIQAFLTSSHVDVCSCRNTIALESHVHPLGGVKSKDVAVGSNLPTVEARGRHQAAPAPFPEAQTHFFTHSQMSTALLKEPTTHNFGIKKVRCLGMDVPGSSWNQSWLVLHPYPLPTPGATLEVKDESHLV